MFQSFPSTRVLSNELSLCIWWLKYWNFNISPSNDYSGLISFRIDWFDLLAVQDPQESSPHHNSKTSVLWHSAFFMVQLSNSYMTTGKTIGLTIWTFLSKWRSLLFNMLPRFGASLVAQMVKHMPAMWETQVRSLGQEDPLEKEMATYSSTLAWKIPWTEEPGRLQSVWLQRVRHNWVISLSFFLGLS